MNVELLEDRTLLTIAFVPESQSIANLASGNRPIIGMDAIGNTVTAADVNSGNIELVRRNSAGVTIGSPIVYNVGGPFTNLVPNIAVEPDGDFSLLYRYQNSAGARFLMLQRFNNAGSTIGTPIQINSDTSQNIQSYQVAVDPAGNHLVVWVRVTGSVPSFLYGQRVDSSGTKVGPEFLIASHDFTDVEIAAAPDGDFIIGALDKFGTQEIFAYRYDTNGNPRHAAATVLATTQDISDIDVAVGDAGNAIFAYSVPGGPAGVFVRKVTPTGLVGSATQVVNQYAQYVGIAADSAGNFVVGWSDLAQYFGNGGTTPGPQHRVHSQGTGLSVPAIAMNAAGTEFAGLWAVPPFASTITPRFVSANLLPNQAPVVTPTGLNTHVVTGLVNFQRSVADAENGLSPLVYAIDLNRDGTFGDTTLPLTVSQLATLGYGPGTHIFDERVTDFHGASTVISNTVVIQASNLPPVVVINGPTTITEGDSLTFNSTGSFDPEGSALSNYLWQVTGSNGTSVTLSNNGLPTLTVPWSVLAPNTDGPGTIQVRLSILDQIGTFGTLLVPISVLNGKPSASMTNIPLVPRSQEQTYTLLASDPSFADVNGVKTWRIDWENDGIVDVTTTTPTVTKSHATAGTFQVRVTVEDKDGGISNPFGYNYTVYEFATAPDAGNPSLTNLLYSGSPGADLMVFEANGLNSIRAYPIGSNPALGQVFNGITGRLIARGFEGDDEFIVRNIPRATVSSDADNDTIRLEGVSGGNYDIDGNAGNDAIFVDAGSGFSATLKGGNDTDTIIGGAGAESIDGGSGNDILVGDRAAAGGNDTIVGGVGLDFIVGGAGVDSFTGGDGEDLIVTGWIADSLLVNPTLPSSGIAQIASQWLASLPVATRLAYITGSPGGSISSTSQLLGGVTRFEDSSIDTLIPSPPTLDGILWDGSLDREIVPFPPMGEFQISNLASPYDPVVGVDALGNYVVAYHNSNRIYIRRYAADGTPLSGDVEVSTGTTNVRPTIAVNDNGEFIVAWEEGGRNVFFRRYDSTGTPITSQVRANVENFSQTAQYPTVSINSSGEAIIAWFFQTGGSTGTTYARRISAAGAVLGGDLALGTFHTQNYTPIRMHLRDNGTFLYVRNSALWNSVGQFYDTANAPIGSIFTIAATASNRTRTDVDMLPDGSFVAIWDQDLFGTVGLEVFARRFDSSGVPLGAAVLVNETSVGSQGSPTVALSPDGSFVAVWNESTTGVNKQMVRRFSSADLPLGPEAQSRIRLNNNAFGLASVAVDAAGEYVIVALDQNSGNKPFGFSSRSGYVSGTTKSPIAGAGGPYYVLPGDSLNFSAASSFDPEGSPLTYSWDINGDGTFGDATGVSPILSWSQLNGLGITAGSAPKIVGLRVQDNRGASTIGIGVPLTVLVGPVVASAGGPYAINEGDGLTLNGTGSIDPNNLSPVITWDLNDDGIFGDATGVSPTLSWNDLVGLGVADGNSIRTIRSRISNSAGLTDVALSTLTVNNVGATAVLTGPSNIPFGSAITLGFSATDPSPVDQAASFTFEIDWTDDGVFDVTQVANTGSAMFTYSSVGAYTIRVRATDKDNGSQSDAIKVVHIHGYQLVPNSGNPLLTDLVWSGSSGADEIVLSPGAPGEVTLQTNVFNGTPVSTSETITGVTGRVVAWGQDGADRIDASALGQSTEIRGGAKGDTIFGGNGENVLYGDSDGGEGGADSIVGGGSADLIYADGPEGHSDSIDGGAGDDVIFADPIQGAEGGNDSVIGGLGADLIDGGLFKDTLIAGDGADVVVGGGEADSMVGGIGEDLFISGSLAASFYASNQQGIREVAQQWRTSDAVATRIAYLTGTPGGIISPAFVLTPGVAVLSDSAVDSVIADDDSEVDWILASVEDDIDSTLVDVISL